MNWRRTGRKFISAGLAVLMIVLGGFPGIGLEKAYAAGGEFAGGDGSAANPYQITKLEQLNNVRNYLDKHFILMNNLDFSLDTDYEDTANKTAWTTGTGWTPIGTTASPFTGVLDGDGHSITGLIINPSTSSTIGLFCSISSDAEIMNIALKEVSISGKSNISVKAGGLAGECGGSVTNCSVSGSVGGNSYVGGLIGSCTGTISNSYSTATVIGYRGPKGTAYKLGVTGGGLVGLLSEASAEITGSYFSGTINSFSFEGGLVGEADGSAISNCYSAGNLTGVVTDGGGLLGVANKATVSNCYALGSIEPYTYPVGGYQGGLIGTVIDATHINYCYSAGNVTGTNPSGLIGFLGGTGNTLTSSYYNSVTSGCSDTDKGTPKTPAEMRTAEAFTGWDFATVWDIVNTETNCSYPYLRCNAQSPAPGYTDKEGIVTVTYDPCGGSVDPTSQLKLYGSTYAKASDGTTDAAMPIPTWAGHTFSGWYTATSGGTKITDSDTVSITGNTTFYAQWTAESSDGDSPPTPTRTIAVTETSSGLFSGSEGQIQAEANMNSAFSNSVEVKVTDAEQGASNFCLGAGNAVYPFDISLYIKGTNIKTEPKDGYAVTIYLPVPNILLDVKEQLSIVHKSDDGTVTTLKSQLTLIDGVWYLVFEATEFSPYALVVSNTGAYDESAGLPYYLDTNGKEVFIGFAAKGKYIAPSGVAVLFKDNPKSFTDTGSHWAKDYIGFVTKRELFTGTGGNTFCPDTGMTRAMFVTVIGRLYERSYGEIEASSTHAFTDCDYSAYYGEYVDWAVENSILGGYGNGTFGPDDQITREQMAAILYRFADFLGVLPNDMDTALTYPDAGAVSSWAENAALYCQSTGIITGRDGGIFAAETTATRAEAAVIMQRFVETVCNGS